MLHLPILVLGVQRLRKRAQRAKGLRYHRIKVLPYAPQGLPVKSNWRQNVDQVSRLFYHLRRNDWRSAAWKNELACRGRNAL